MRSCGSYAPRVVKCCFSRGMFSALPGLRSETWGTLLVLLRKSCAALGMAAEAAAPHSSIRIQRSMRVTVSHNGRKEEIMRSVDRSFDDLFKDFGTVPIKIVNETRSWTGSRMDFSFNAKVGIVSTPIKGFVDVTDRDVTVDADLGWLERLFPAKQTQAALQGRIKGLLS